MIRLSGSVKCVAPCRPVWLVQDRKARVCDQVSSCPYAALPLRVRPASAPLRRVLARLFFGFLFQSRLGLADLPQPALAPLQLIRQFVAMPILAVLRILFGIGLSAAASSASISCFRRASVSFMCL